MKVIKKICNMFIKYFYDLFHFGIKIAHYNIWGELADFKVFKGDLRERIADKRYIAINDFLTKKYGYLIKEYKEKEEEIGNYSKIIWVLWWQGIDNAPELVKKCVNSIIRNSEGFEVVIITKDNFYQYAEFPSIIIKKLNKKKITLTHFSDILRAKLLSTYGGIWCDATMYFNYNIFTEFDNVIFNSNRVNEEHKYCGYFMGGRSNKLFRFLYQFLIDYNTKYNKLINYFLIDYVIKIAYANFDECRNYIDNITLHNSNIKLLKNSFNKTYNAEEYLRIMNNHFFKLTFKEKFVEYDKDGNLTNYGYFMKED